MEREANLGYSLECRQCDRKLLYEDISCTSSESHTLLRVRDTVLLRHIAEGVGWLFVNGNAFCPKCQKALYKLVDAWVVPQAIVDA